ncbi:MAG: GNAT family N-acetyltransferase [Oscillospiraceae bacterium]|nr:GNAT family N-acetyltransferase [Oscillospiraceae bacterium]
MIRPYHEKDLQACAAVYCSAFSAPPWHEQWTAELAQTRVRELMCTPMSYGYVCEENGQILGFAAGRLMTYLYGREYVIDEFCVSYETQGRGIGSILMQHIIAEMKSRFCAAVVLNTTRGYPSEAFYLKNGFVQAEDMITLYLHLK